MSHGRCHDSSFSPRAVLIAKSIFCSSISWRIFFGQ